MNYIQRIRDLREDADCTQTQIAEYLGTSQTMYARYERGANANPTFDCTVSVLSGLCRLYPRLHQYQKTSSCKKTLKI